MELKEKQKWEQWFDENLEYYEKSDGEFSEEFLSVEKFLEAIALAKEEAKAPFQAIMEKFNDIASKLMKLPNEERLRILGGKDVFPKELDVEHPDQCDQ